MDWNSIRMNLNLLRLELQRQNAEELEDDAYMNELQERTMGMMERLEELGYTDDADEMGATSDADTEPASTDDDDEYGDEYSMKCSVEWMCRCCLNGLQIVELDK